MWGHKDLIGNPSSRVINWDALSPQGENIWASFLRSIMVTVPIHPPQCHQKGLNLLLNTEMMIACSLIDLRVSPALPGSSLFFLSDLKPKKFCISLWCGPLQFSTSNPPVGPYFRGLITGPSNVGKWGPLWDMKEVRSLDAFLWKESWNPVFASQLP